MSIINFTKQHVTNKTIVHLAMLVFAITSTLNVAGFFVATHHHVIIAGSIGLALGAGLMAVSIYLSNQDMSNRTSFSLMAFAAVSMALLSGQIQTMNYQLHGLDTFTAYLLGYSPPFVVEILLALSVSLAERNERERVRRDSKAHIKDSVATAMTDAFRDVDTARIQKHIDRQVDSVVKAFVDDAPGEMLAELRPTTGDNTHSTPQPTETPTDAQNDEIDSKTADITTKPHSATIQPTVDELNERRRELVDIRHDAIVQLCEAYGAMSAPELVERLQDDRDIEVSAQTVRDDCNTLVDNGRLVRDGRKWAVMSATLPTMAAPVLNGVNHA